ncbi:copper homeostasis protein CutC [Flavobacteriaceae bacterium]|nr:copper homeostasis protein CutC [Flavobacteriaceae bacterium]MDB4256457.1 copper homeostasis protein CutC [Flavobacteriaceae bacterium]MDC0636862.1 copper homeostasis protein CutC [Flavobacteriaceae bacterium]
MILEICANSYQSAVNANIAGAHRIELCSEISVGGTTPSYGLLKKVMADIDIPVHVLIRPRSGNFTYSGKEVDIMKENIRLCKDLGCAGIVSGVLHEDNSIDIKRTSELIELSKPMSFTFHRAFDVVFKPKEALLQLLNLGVDRLLTSGQEEKAEDGIDLLIELQKMAKNKITILPGSGINSKNCIHFKNTGFTEIHSSASKIISGNSHSYFGNTPQIVSDINSIKNILDSLA